MQTMKLIDPSSELVSTNDLLVYRVLHSKFSSIVGTDHMDDFVQVGRIGLIKASQSFNPQLAQFSTYAYWKILGEMQRYYRDFVKDETVTVCLDDPDENYDLSLNYDIEVQIEQRILLKNVFEIAKLKLSAKHTSVLKLFLLGFSLKEIAIQLGISAPYAGKCLKRLRQVAGVAYGKNQV